MTWFFSVYRLFGISEVFMVFLAIIISGQVLDILMKHILDKEKNKEPKGTENRLTMKEFLKENLNSIIFLGYSIFLLI